MKNKLSTLLDKPRTRGMIALCLSMTSLILACSAQATETLTQVTKLSNRYDIQHYIRVADAEELLMRMGAAGTVATSEGLTLLAKYVEANFQASGEFGAVTIETLSAEVDDQFVYIEQMTSTAVSGALPQQLELESRLLQDLDTQAVSYIELQAGPQTTLVRVTTGCSVRLFDPRSRDLLY